MKIGVIDIGSNSVRLMLWADGKTLYKRMKTTRLGEGLNVSPYIRPDASQRTVEAIAAFKAEAIYGGAERVYAFATAAVRTAVNREEFLAATRVQCGIEVRVLTGEEEALSGLCGAVGGGDGGIIDIGGASTEVSLRQGGKIIYSKSVDIGTVRILGAAGRDLARIAKFVESAIAAYGEYDFSSYKMYAVGGTATRLASVKLGLTEYCPEKLDGTPITVDEAYAFARELTSLPVEKIAAETICKKSADLIGGGAMLLNMIMKKFRIGEVTVSDGDNLEGFASLFTDGGNLR